MRLPTSQGDTLRLLIQGFIRESGLLSVDQTPCGKPLAISHAHALMVLLDDRRGGRKPTQQELGRVLRIDKSNVTRLCQKMEKAGQVIQERGPGDGRMRLLALTDRGVRLARSVEQASRQRFQRLIMAVRQDRRERVLEALAVLNDALAVAASGAATTGRRGSAANRASAA